MLVLPGLTGWAQVKSPHGASVDDAQAKLAYDLTTFVTKPSARPARSA